MFTESAQETRLTDTNNTTVVSAPGSGVRRLIQNIHFDNPDSVQHYVSLFKTTAAGDKRLLRVLIASNAFYTFNKLTVLNATSESVYAVLDANPTSEGVTIDVAFADTN